MVTNRDATGNHLDSAEKIAEFAQTTGAVDFFDPRSGIFGTHLAQSFRMSKSSYIMYPDRSREILNCSAIDLAEIQRSSKISS